MSAEERDYVRGLEKALEWFADPANWHEEELCEGYHFTAEWKLGLDPREIARRALAGAVNADVRRASWVNDDLVAALKEADAWLDASLGLVRGDRPPNWDGIREHRTAIAAVLAKAEVQS